MASSSSASAATTKKSSTLRTKTNKATPTKATKEEPTLTAPVVEESSPEDAVEAALQPTEAAAVATAPGFASLLDAINTHFQTVEKELRAGKALLKKLNQLHNKELKHAASQLKSGRRKRERDPNAPKRAPSGIAKPSNISPELAAFLKVEPEKQLARTDVIRQIAGYIKSNNLENPTNRREIIPDKDLAKLLNIEKGHKEKITYFNLQRWMKPHFPKAVSVA